MDQNSIDEKSISGKEDTTEMLLVMPVYEFYRNEVLDLLDYSNDVSVNDLYRNEV